MVSAQSTSGNKTLYDYAQNIFMDKLTWPTVSAGLAMILKCDLQFTINSTFFIDWLKLHSMQKWIATFDWCPHICLKLEICTGTVSLQSLWSTCSVVCGVHAFTTNSTVPQSYLYPLSCIPFSSLLILSSLHQPCFRKMQQTFKTCLITYNKIYQPEQNYM